ncbi:hypothetical protein ASPZODRAFT_1962049 [Penicilliopsis zonata CBS 506.65]|uniref:Uncharacterized protein n=1 Tax=Penicilliopsis zonata CBS 506.65 TaxID=1073090 RepID=A0A1L9SHA1_9EURO|nr:hypothetical protein ASPZODRAFT_1962049 [Penicilliopsis zonata CBS 506.65]OJJ46454.1 hypothetical protein ASPZODRAFT_1962049 [Penicilliopsis zonata CBS 506.65]
MTQNEGLLNREVDEARKRLDERNNERKTAIAQTRNKMDNELGELRKSREKDIYQRSTRNFTYTGATLKEVEAYYKARMEEREKAHKEEIASLEAYHTRRVQEAQDLYLQVLQVGANQPSTAIEPSGNTDRQRGSYGGSGALLYLEQSTGGWRNW